MKTKLLIFFTCILPGLTLHAQQGQGQLEINLNKSIFQPRDSLFVHAEYRNGSGQIGMGRRLATLQLIIEHEQGLRTTLRWPVIKGQASGALYLPDSLPHGKYTLFAGLQTRFFEVIGKITDVNSDGVQAMLLTKTGEWDQQSVLVASDGTFAIRNWLFEDNALLAFSRIKNNNQPLNIEGITTQLDSSNKPLAVAARAFYIGNPPAAVRAMLDQPIETTEPVFADQGSLLPAVVVKSTAKSRAEQYDEEHVRGMFRSGDERMLNIMDDPNAVGSFNVFSYLQGRVAGLQIANNISSVVARWRGSPVTFFLDEVNVPAQTIAYIPMADIAIIKAYPPPFFGAPGSGGGIAIYTRRGGESRYLPANRQVFKVKGYTPSATVLDINKLSL